MRQAGPEPRQGGVRNPFLPLPCGPCSRGLPAERRAGVFTGKGTTSQQRLPGSQLIKGSQEVGGLALSC